MKQTIENEKQSARILFKALRELIDPPVGLLDQVFIEKLSKSTRFSARELNQIGNRLVFLYQAEKSETQDVLISATKYSPNQHMDLMETAKTVYMASQGSKRSQAIIKRWEGK